MLDEHDINGLVDDHAGRCFIRELGIELKAQFCEEVDGSLEVYDRQVYKDLIQHVESLGCRDLLAVPYARQ